MEKEVILISDSDTSVASTFVKVVPTENTKDCELIETIYDSCVAVVNLDSNSTILTASNNLPRRHSLSSLRSNYLDSPAIKVTAWLDKNYDSFVLPLKSYETTESTVTIHNCSKLLKDHPKPIQLLLESKVESLSTTSVDSSSRTNTPMPIVDKSKTELEGLSNHEMQKKFELCEYLKLMNRKPQRKLKSELSQNRRSSRVKNLVLKNEKKAFEKQSRVEPDANSNCAVKNFNQFSNSKGLNYPMGSNLSIESSINKAGENTLKSCKIRNTSQYLDSTNSDHTNLRVSTRSHHRETLQVPEISSTSIASNYIKLQNTNHSSSRSKKLITKGKSSVDKILVPDNNNYKSSKSENSKKSRNEQKLKTISDISSLQTSYSVSCISGCSTSRKKSTDTITTNIKTYAVSRNKVQKRKDIETHNSKLKRHKLDKPLKLRLKRKILNVDSEYKIIKKKKHFRSFQRLNRLRSSGKLRQLELESILYRYKKRKIVKKNSNTDGKLQELSNLDAKKFVQTELIQPGLKCRRDSVNLNLKLYESNFLFSGLTPEHRLALIESKKFLDSNYKLFVSPQASLDCIGFNHTETSESINSFEKIKLVFEYLCDRFNNRLERIFLYSFEDLEVNQLMEKSLAKNNIATVSTPEQSSNDMCLRDTYVQSSSSYPQSSDSYLFNAKSGRNTVSDITSNIDVLLPSTNIPEDNNKQRTISVVDIDQNQCECEELSIIDETVIKSLNDCLTKPVLKQKDTCTKRNWSEKQPILSHTVSISKDNDAVIGAYYLDFNLVVVQKLSISFWSQTPLGNVLGTQDMWVPRGCTERLILEKGCIRKESSEVVMCLLDSVAYFELWTKEHKSEKRERPLADVFVTVYFTSQGPCGKKVLQLENIQGYASDVQYIILRSSRNIVVSWNVMSENVSNTIIHCYQLSADYQTVQSIKEVQSVNHYLTSLHNIEDCDNIIMGYGDQKITLWNFENLDCCYIIATIDLTGTASLRTHWAKCDRGFLFTLHELNTGALQLIAINSNASTWKSLRTYNKPELEYTRLNGVCIECGLVVASYDTGLSCWNAHTGDLLLESHYNNQLFLSFGSCFVIVLDDKVHVRQALEYIFSMEDAEFS